MNIITGVRVDTLYAIYNSDNTVKCSPSVAISHSDKPDVVSYKNKSYIVIFTFFLLKYTFIFEKI